MTLRKGTLDDIPFIVWLGMEMHSDSSFKNVPYSADRVAAMATILIEHGFVMLIEIDGKVVGGMLGDVISPWYTTERMGTDFALYISPEHRTGTAAFKLVKAFEKWCESMGATTIRPGVSTGSKTAGKLYKALGYEQVGECYMKKLGD